MKNAKKLSRAQYYFVGKKGLNPSEWLVIKDTPTEMQLVKKKSMDAENKEKEFKTLKKV